MRNKPRVRHALPLSLTVPAQRARCGVLLRGGESPARHFCFFFPEKRDVLGVYLDLRDLL